MNPTEGIIKFDLAWEEAPPPEPAVLVELIAFRDVLHRKYLIAADEEGIGFGNISHRSRDGFIISGTQTGQIHATLPQDYTEVIDWDTRGNRVTCRGPVRASSESMTHAAVYEARPDVRGVIHVHHHALWTKMLDRAPTTAANIEYGSTELAGAVGDIARGIAAGRPGILAMAGHEAGLLSFGCTLEDALQILLDTKEAYGQ